MAMYKNTKALIREDLRKLNNEYNRLLVKRASFFFGNDEAAKNEIVEKLTKIKLTMNEHLDALEVLEGRAPSE